MEPCPTCDKDALRPHCAANGSTTCDLVACRNCKSFGTPDGRRWVVRDGMAA